MSVAHLVGSELRQLLHRPRVADVRQSMAHLKKDSMDYQIHGRVEIAAGGRYTAIAQAVPSTDGAMKELREAYATRPLAVAGLRKLAVKLGAMIRAHGDDVIDVKTEE